MCTWELRFNKTSFYCFIKDTQVKLTFFLAVRAKWRRIQWLSVQFSVTALIYAKNRWNDACSAIYHRFCIINANVKRVRQGTQCLSIMKIVWTSQTPWGRGSYYRTAGPDEWIQGRRPQASLGAGDTTAQHWPSQLEIQPEHLLHGSPLCSLLLGFWLLPPIQPLGVDTCALRKSWLEPDLLVSFFLFLGHGFGYQPSGLRPHDEEYFSGPFWGVLAGFTSC